MLPDHPFPPMVRDLPDPLTGQPRPTQLDLDFWRHIRKHLLHPAQWWAELWPPRTHRQVTDEPLSHNALLDASTVLFEQLRHSLSRPLVLRRDEWSREGMRRTDTCVLPCGALVIVGRSRSPSRIITAYFPRLAQQVSSCLRWRATVRVLLGRHAVFVGRHIRHPAPDHTFSVRDLDGQIRRQRQNVRYLAPAPWGFVADADGWRFTGQVPDWPDAPDTPRLPLRPRFRRSRVIDPPEPA